MDIGNRYKEFFIFAVGKRGCTDYEQNVINNFPNNYDLYLSKYYIQHKPNLNARTIYTYKSAYSFILLSFFYLPFILIGILYRIIRFKYKAVYFPYFHHWNIFVLLIFKLSKKSSIVTVHDGIMHSGDGYPLEQFLNNLTIKLSDKLIFLTKHVEKITKINA